MTLTLVVNRDHPKPDEALKAMGELAAILDKLITLHVYNPDALLPYADELAVERDFLNALRADVHWERDIKKDLTGKFGRKP